MQHNPQTENRTFELTTEDFARKNLVKDSTVRTHLYRFGSYHGIRPLKLASGRMLWPNVYAVR